MRILTVGHSYVVSMNRLMPLEWALAGHDVTVAAPQFYHADLRPMPCDPIGQAPFDLVEIPARWTKRVHIFRYGHKLRNLLKTGRFDIIHAWEEPFIYAGFQVARWTPAETPLIFSTFQNLPKRYPPPFSWMERHAMRKATAWTAFGQTIANNLKIRNVYRDKPWIEIPLGVDTSAFQPDEVSKRIELKNVGWPESAVPVIGYVGRFVEEKGLRHLMKVLDQIEAPGKRWKALFVGGGPLESELREWASGYSDSVVKILTGVEHDRVPKLLNAIDICAVPSQTRPHWQEQLGRILIEAMASGVPVLASHSGEIPHVVGQAGVVIPEDDIEQWVKSLNRLLDQPLYRSELAGLGLQRVLENYAWPIVARRFLTFFEQIRNGG